MKKAQIVSPDGYISSIATCVENDSTLQAQFSFPEVPDYILGAIKEQKPFIFTARSGNAQIGIKTDVLTPETVPLIEGREVYLDGRLENLNPLLGEPLNLFRKGNEIGRLVIMDPELRITDVRHYLHKRLFVGRERKKGHSEGFEIRQEKDPATGKMSDYILVELEPYQYCFESVALNDSSVSNVITKGRIALAAIRSRIPVQLATRMIEPASLFVGAIKISLGDIYGVIDTVTEPETANVQHLPARLLDPFRTFRDRQVELFNFGCQGVALSSIKVKIRFFRANNPLTVPLIKNKVKNGYRLYDLLTNSEVSDLFQSIEKGALGIILNKNTFTQIPRALDPSGQAQLEILRKAVQDSTVRKPVVEIDSCASDDFKRTLEKLSVLGGVNSRVFISETFPLPEVIDTLRISGVRTFLSNAKDPSFDDDYIKKMLRLTHTEATQCEFLRYEAGIDKLYTFYHGCFIEPDDRERFDAVRYWFAFYGSHINEADNLLTIELIDKLSATFGYEMGIVHGGGPGLMKEANDLARHHNIMSIGIAIDLEGEHQLSLTTCDGLIKYREGLRLARQDHLQKLSNLAIINTGGYGSAEELAITVTSMKIHENPLAPIILLDQNNLWSHSQKQINEIAENGYGPSFIPHLVKPCRNAEDAYREIKQFCMDPPSWYARNEIPATSVEEAINKSRRIRFEMFGRQPLELFEKPNVRLVNDAE